MIVKLTHQGKPTLINPAQVVSLYMDTNLRTNEFKTKIITTNGTVFVDEKLNEAHRLLNKGLNGEDTNGFYDYDVPSIDDRIENEFNSGYRDDEFNQPPRYNKHSYRQKFERRY